MKDQYGFDAILKALARSEEKTKPIFPILPITGMGAGGVTCRTVSSEEILLHSGSAMTYAPPGRPYNREAMVNLPALVRQQEKDREPVSMEFPIPSFLQPERRPPTFQERLSAAKNAGKKRRNKNKKKGKR